MVQHVPYEPLGTLNPLIKKLGHRIRYLNFSREGVRVPKIDNYDGLILLGGSQNIGEEDKYPYLNTEKKLILKAIELDKPVLGICLGAQLIASALGARVSRMKKEEIGWQELSVTKKGADDPVISCFRAKEQIFQWHGFHFEWPLDSVPLITGINCKQQAFRYKDNVYGFQFHLEVDSALIERWLQLPDHQTLLAQQKRQTAAFIDQQTTVFIERSKQLSHNVFGAFLALLPAPYKRHILKHR